MKNRRTWRTRLFGELPIIIAGVLIALGINSLIEAAAVRRRESQYLTSLQAEFAANRSILESNLQSLREIVSADRELIAMARSSALNATPDSLNKLIQNANSFVVFTPESSVTSTLIASGDLGIIRDAELRTLLAGWETTRANQRLPENYMITQTELRDELRDIPIADVYGLTRGDSTKLDLYSRVIRTRDFENHIASRLLVSEWNYRTTDATLGYVGKVEDRLKRLRR